MYLLSVLTHLSRVDTTERPPCPSTLTQQHILFPRDIILPHVLPHLIPLPHSPAYQTLFLPRTQLTKTLLVNLLLPVRSLSPSQCQTFPITTYFVPSGNSTYTKKTENFVAQQYSSSGCSVYYFTPLLAYTQKRSTTPPLMPHLHSSRDELQWKLGTDAVILRLLNVITCVIIQVFTSFFTYETKKCH